MPPTQRSVTKWLLVALAGGSIATAAFLSFGKAEETDHRKARQLVLHYTLSRVEAPVVVLGDSITEASTLPRAVCGHPIVNAGLNGASTATDLGTWLAQALAGRRPALIVVALGTNDALVSSPPSREAFVTSYRALLAQLSKLTSRLAITGIPPVQAERRVTSAMATDVSRTVDGYNIALRDLADRNGLRFVALPPFPAPGTIDGVHLNAAGYQAWESAVLQAAGAVCG